MDQPIQAEFNSGLAIIYQLDAIEKGMIEATIEKDIHKHYRCLVSYFKTLFPHMKSKFQERHMQTFRQMRKQYNQLTTEMKKENKRVPAHLIEDFDDWELLLRQAKQIHGLGMPEKDKRYQGSKR